MKKTTFVDQVLAVLKGGDEAKITRFSAKLEKYLDKQIAIRRDGIETLMDKKADAEEALRDAVLNVDTHRINSTDGVEAYCASYTSIIDQKLNVIDSLEEQMEHLADEIEKFETIKSSVFGAE
jgi:Mg2+ and Co2+ transporter CorA